MTRTQAIDLTTAALGALGIFSKAMFWMRVSVILVAGAAAGATFYFLARIL